MTPLKLDDVGQVVLAGRIVVLYLGDQGKEGTRLGADDSGVAEGDRAFIGGRVLELADGEKVVPLGQEAAVAAGVARVEAEDDDSVFRAGVQHRAEGFLADQRRVGVKDDRLARCVGKKGGSLGDGVGGAELRVLDDGLYHLGIRSGRGRDSLAPVAGDCDDAGGFQPVRGGKRVMEEGGGGDLVQDLGRVGVHPRALPCGQDDD